MDNLSTLLEFATESCYLAGQLSLGYFRRNIKPERKNDNSPVTIADKEAEQLMRQRIAHYYPEHGILGEEFGMTGTAETRWIIDPIDGTKGFMRGVPLYGVLMALEHRSEILVGVAYFPALGEMVSAAKGQGAFLNGRRVFVSQEDSIENAFISTTDFNNLKKYHKLDAFNRLAQGTYYRAGWGDAYGHALVATGRLEIMCDPIMSPWDSAPFGVIMPEAGGYSGTWAGDATVHGKDLVSCNAALKDVVLERLKDEKGEAS